MGRQANAAPPIRPVEAAQQQEKEEEEALLARAGLTQPRPGLAVAESRTEQCRSSTRVSGQAGRQAEDRHC